MALTTPLQLDFDRSMDIDSIALLGTLAPATDRQWSRVTAPNDRLRLVPQPSWPEGPVTLTVVASDADGVMLPAVELQYTVDGTSPQFTSVPADGDILEHHADIVLTFGEPITMETLGGTLSGGATAALGPTHVLTISSGAPWPLETARDVSGAVADAVGNQTVFDLSFLQPPYVAFTTQSTGSGVLSTWSRAGAATGLAAGDAICQSEADAAGLVGDFVAWLSDSANDAYCRVHGLSGTVAGMCGGAVLPATAGPWVRTDGYPFAPTIDRLTTGVVYAPAILDADGVELNSNLDTWTGTQPSGVGAAGEMCGDWTSSAGFARNGYAAGGASRWSAHTIDVLCNVSRRLTCLQVGTQDPPLPAFATTGLGVFLTSTSGTGELSTWPNAGGQAGLAAADEICRSLAANAGLANATRYQAWLSSTTVDARDRITSNGPWRRTDRVLVAVDRSDWTDGLLFAPITQDENGNGTIVTGTVWTGSDDTGAAATTCLDWTTSATGADGEGEMSHVADVLALAQPLSCAGTRHLICIED